MSRKMGVEYPHVHDVMVIDIRKFMVIEVLIYVYTKIPTVWHGFRNGPGDGLSVKLVV